MLNPERLAVFDTNVIVSGFLSPFGAPGRIVDGLRKGAIQAVLDDRIVAEYEDVLQRPEFALPHHEVTIVLDGITAQARWVQVEPAQVLIPNTLPDPSDAPFAECALLARCALVTGNRKHYPTRLLPDVAVLSPREFVDRLATAT